MKRKFWILLLVVTMLFSVHCSAEIVTEKPQFLSDGYVNIKGESDVISGQVAFKVARVKGNNTDYVAIKETITDSEGKFEFLFRIPEQINEEISNGSYRYWMVSEDGEKKEGTFEYINFEYILKKIRVATSGTDLYNIINNCTEDDNAAFEVMGISVDDISEMKSKLVGIADEWFGLCTVATDELTDIVGAFNKAMGIEYARAGNIEKALELINPAYGMVEFKNAPNKSVITTVVKNNSDTESLEKFYKSYELSNKLIEFTGLRAAKLVEAIKNYDEYFNFSKSGKYSSYSGMDMTKQGKVADKLSELIGDETVKVSQLVSAFEEAVKFVENSGGNGGNSGGGGSSGGSGGGGNRNTGVYSTGETENEYQIEINVSETANKNEVFSDIDKVAWAKEAIEILADKKIIAGNGDGKFNPNGYVTREEFTKMVVLAAGIYDAEADCEFSDVDISMWYYRYIASAVAKGVIQGTGDGVYGTGNRITRQDMVVIVKRAATAAGKVFAKTKPFAEFNDFYMIADYAKESVDELYCAGIVNGVDGNAFAPIENCTRAQAAKIIYEAFVR